MCVFKSAYTVPASQQTTAPVKRSTTTTHQQQHCMMALSRRLQQPQCGHQRHVVPNTMPSGLSRLGLSRHSSVVGQWHDNRRGAVRAVSGQVRETSNSNGRANVAEPLEAEQAAEVPKKQFNWYKQWYPVAVLEDLDKGMPMHAQLLGMDMAIWWDSKAEQWRAFQDRCPHRLAPLSEGIIDAKTGNLYCNYHGWTFNGEGRCTSVPQLPEGQTLSSSRSCVASYPTRSAEGLLWVWADASPTALIESAAEDAWPGLAPEIDEQGDKAFSRTAAKHKWYSRVMPYPYLAAKENAYNDYSHDTVLHHGVSAFANRANAKPISMRLSEMTPNGYKVSETSGDFTDITRFPCGARRERVGHAGIAYVVPTGVGSCRQFHTFLQNDPPAGSAAATAASSRPKSLQSRLSGFQGWLRGQKPMWMQHLFGHVLIDADIAIQARVDYNRAQNDHVYMPAAADAGPASFMRWLKEYGGGGPPVTKLKAPFVGHTPTVVQDRRQLLDRLNQHTMHCKACRTAYQRFSTALSITRVLALVAASAAVAVTALAAAGAVVATPGSAAALTAGSSGGWGVAAALGVLAALLGAGYAALQQLVQKFIHVDYDRDHVGKQPSH